MDAAGTLSYAAVTPARDEEDHLGRLGAALAAQTIRPTRWVIVENGSSDRTIDVARDLADRFDWIKVMQIEGTPRYVRTKAESAFEVGVRALEGAGDLVAKLDADVSFEPDFFARMISTFTADPTLGVASGTLLEERDGAWNELPLLGDHCWGPTRTYRRACLEQVLPLDAGPCFTWVDETKARLAGFRTSTLRELPFRHHRWEGADEGTLWEHWRSQGEGSHHLGYRPSYLLARTAWRALSQPAALALIVGYGDAALRRAPRYPDPRVLEAIREQQRARRFLGAVGGRLGHGQLAGRLVGERGESCPNGRWRRAVSSIPWRLR